MSKKLIKWSELSRVLSGSDNSVRSYMVPKKYVKDVEELLRVIELWKSKL